MSVSAVKWHKRAGKDTEETVYLFKKSYEKMKNVSRRDLLYEKALALCSDNGSVPSYGDPVLSYLFAVTSTRPPVNTIVSYYERDAEKYFNGTSFVDMCCIFNQKPVPKSAWSGVRNGTSFGFDCVPHVKAATINPNSEDCLTLNVFRPKNIPQNKKLPVLVWIHGGGFEIGSASLFGYKGFADIYIPEDLIIVTIQYRIGLLGFFSTGDSRIPGNLGLWDQVLSLQWIQQNIGVFGGDARQVTIWGLSAGGCAVGQIGLMKEAQGLFANAIEQSGSPYSSWGIGPHVKQNSLDFATAIGCNAANVNMKECLKTKTLDEIFQTTLTVGYAEKSMKPIKWGPVVDGELMTDVPSKLIKNAPKKPTFLGIGNKDGGYFSLLGYSPYIQKLNISAKVSTWGRQDLVDSINFLIRDANLYGQRSAAAANKIIEYYVNAERGEGPKDRGFYIDRYNMFLTDIFLVAPAVQEVLEKCSSGWPVYAYSFDHTNSVVFQNRDIPVKAQGSVHVNEYPYMFGLYAMGWFNMSTPEETIVKETLQQSMISFVKTGKPSSSHGQWKDACSWDLRYLSISPTPQMKQFYYLDNFSFWFLMKKEYGFDMVSMLPETTWWQH